MQSDAKRKKIKNATETTDVTPEEGLCVGLQMLLERLRTAGDYYESLAECRRKQRSSQVDKTVTSTPRPQVLNAPAQSE